MQRSVQSVTAKFGNPIRTEDTPSFTIDRRLFYYAAEDEFGNPTLVVLTFQAVCTSNAKTPECYRLVDDIRTTADSTVLLNRSEQPSIAASQAPTKLPPEPANDAKVKRDEEKRQGAIRETPLTPQVSVEKKKPLLRTLSPQEAKAILIAFERSHGNNSPTLEARLKLEDVVTINDTGAQAKTVGEGIPGGSAFLHYEFRDAKWILLRIDGSDARNQLESIGAVAQ